MKKAFLIGTAVSVVAVAIYMTTGTTSKEVVKKEVQMLPKKGVEVEYSLEKRDTLKASTMNAFRDGAKKSSVDHKIREEKIAQKLKMEYEQRRQSAIAQAKRQQYYQKRVEDQRAKERYFKAHAVAMSDAKNQAMQRAKMDKARQDYIEFQKARFHRQKMIEQIKKETKEEGGKGNA
jgi:hypothetical protein